MSGAAEGDADWRGMVNLHILGVLLTAHTTIAEFRKRRGTLVLTGSGAGQRHIARSAYGTTK